MAISSYIRNRMNAASSSQNIRIGRSMPMAEIATFVGNVRQLQSDVSNHLAEVSAKLESGDPTPELSLMVQKAVLANLRATAFLSVVLQWNHEMSQIFVWSDSDEMKFISLKQEYNLILNQFRDYAKDVPVTVPDAVPVPPEIVPKPGEPELAEKIVRGIAVVGGTIAVVAGVFYAGPALRAAAIALLTYVQKTGGMAK